ADPRLTGEVDHGAMPALDLLPGLRQAGQLVVSAHQRGEPTLTGDLEPADGPGGAQDPMHADMARDALELLGAQRLGDEVALDQISRRVADHDGLWCGDRLQARRDVGRLANDGHPL